MSAVNVGVGDTVGWGGGGRKHKQVIISRLASDIKWVTLRMTSELTIPLFPFSITAVLFVNQFRVQALVYFVPKRLLSVINCLKTPHHFRISGTNLNSISFCCYYSIILLSHKTTVLNVLLRVVPMDRCALESERRVNNNFLNFCMSVYISIVRIAKIVAPPPPKVLRNKRLKKF